MSDNQRTPSNDGGHDGPVRLAERLANTQAFMDLFREGMDLVEETASYLDTEGRESSRVLDRAGSLAYATESMRLTTRLMQLASWLLLQRAVNEGEMTKEQAGQEKSKVRLDTLSSPQGGTGFDALPDKLRDLIARSLRLQDRIRMIDAAIYGGDDVAIVKEAPQNPVAAHLDRLSSAFGSPRPPEQDG